MAKKISSSGGASPTPAADTRKTTSTSAPETSSRASGNGSIGVLPIVLVAALAVVIGMLYNQNQMLKAQLSQLSNPVIHTRTAVTPEVLHTETVREDGSPIMSASELADLESHRIVPKNANAMGKPREATRDCVDRHAECKEFKRNGECTKNPGWMIVNCPRSCNDVNHACHLRDPKIRCQRSGLNMSTTPIYAPGDMDRMFRQIEQRFGKRYEVKVHSTSPWVVTFENFVTDAEADALIRSINRWERSTDTGLMNDYGESGRVLSTGRTSSNGWCNAECESHPKVRNVMHKIEEITGVPSTNYESFQVLRYEKSQKYQVHHDYGAEDVGLACGPRILTFFLYLSDVEEGGETAFDKLGIAVKPKKGRALLWPSTLNENPEEVDPRTTHEARPVIRGTKMAANAWIHLFDYHTPNLWGCTGSFDEL